MVQYATGQSTQLCVPAGATSYLWSTGATTNCITVSTPGTYTVTVTNAGGCVSTCSKTVTASTSPVCTITGNTSICQGQATKLCAPAGCTKYLWSNGATTNCITVSTAGTYTVTTTNAAGCTSTCSKTVTVECTARLLYHRQYFNLPGSNHEALCTRRLYKISLEQWSNNKLYYSKYRRNIYCYYNQCQQVAPVPAVKQLPLHRLPVPLPAILQFARVKPPSFVHQQVVQNISGVMEQ